MNLLSMPPELQEILQRDGFVIFICGPKEKGKTNLALLLSEISFIMQWRKFISTNISTASYMIVNQITNFPDLQSWLKQLGKKLFTLDEAGKILKKMRFMSDQNQKWMDVIQLTRHYDAGFIGCAPSESFIDNNFLNTDILDVKIRKLTQTRAKVYDYLHNSTYFWNDIPITSIKYNDKDIAIFEMEKHVSVTEMQECCQLAYYLEMHGSIQKARKCFVPEMHIEKARRLLVEHLRHTRHTQNTHNQEVGVTIKNT